MRLDTFREAVLLALEELRANKFRSTLTILGIIVGVATVMAMSGVITGIRSSVLNDIEAAGPNNFIIGRFNFSEVRLTGGSGPPWGSNPKVTPAEAKLIGSLSLVRSAIVDFDLSAEMGYRDQHVDNVQVSADDAGWEEFTRVTFLAGHNFLPSDVQHSRPVVVISRQLGEALFGSLDPVGRTLRVDGRPFTVLGVFELSGNIFASVIKHIAIMPYTSALKQLNANDDFLSVLVVTADGADQQEAIDQVVAALRTSRKLRPGEENDFAIIRQEEIFQTFNRITGIFFVVMIALSSVALLVGGVGVVAIMMIAVTERTREIGVRKALGATRREILWQFLIEAATLTVIGGAIGLLIGGGAALLVGAVTPIPAAVPIGAVVGALGMAAVAGVAFGLWPAWRAARLDPVEALRYE